MKHPPMRYSRPTKRPLPAAAPAAEQAKEQSILESSPKAEKSFWEKPWVIPTATAISTAILSGLVSWGVMAYQLSSEHSFTSWQKSEERRQRLMDEKVRLLGEATKLSGQLLGFRRQIAVDSFRVGFVSISMLQLDKTGATQTASKFSADLDRAECDQREDLIRLFSTAAEMQSVLKMSSVHFGPQSQEALRKLGTIMPPIEPPINPQTPLPEVYSHFTTQLKAEDEYANSVYQVIDTMATEAAAEFSSASK